MSPAAAVSDVSHVLGALVLLMSFALLYQRRLLAVIGAFALQAVLVAAAAAWQAYSHDALHLYLTAAIALLVKAVAIPYSLRWIVRKLGIHDTVETALGVNLALLAGVALVILSIVLVFPLAAVGGITRESLAIALSIVLIGLLMMITRRNAVTQVVGFMSMENGLMLAAVGVPDMPLVVEISAAFALLIAFIVFGMFFFSIRERFDTLDLQFLDSHRGDRPGSHG